VVIRVPYAPIYHSPALPTFKDYGLSATSLTTPYFQAIFGSAKLSWKLSPPIHTMSNVTTDYFDIYAEYLRHSKITTLSSLRNRGQQSLASTLGRSIGLLKPKCKKPLTPEQARENYQNLLGCYSLVTTLNDTPLPRRHRLKARTYPPPTRHSPVPAHPSLHARVGSVGYRALHY
jgi:hypothetical protein